MTLDNSDTIFNLLAMMCSFLSKEDERECALKWETASEKDINRFLEKYNNFLMIILNSSLSEYKFNIEEIQYLNGILHMLESMDEKPVDEVYLLVLGIEKSIDSYDIWQRRGLVYKLEPLNSNFLTMNISIYPRFLPQWDISKSERMRERTLNAKFQNYMMIRKEDASPLDIIMHYWNDSGLLQKTTAGWVLKVALVPVMDSARLKKRDVDTGNGTGIIVEGIQNEGEVESRVLHIFDVIFEKGYSIIIFPETLGTNRLVEVVKNRMRLHPEYCTFVLLPTICNNEHNTLFVLGPGGIEILRQDKGTPFVLIESDGVFKKEQLEYTNQVHILITKELGNIAFPICAELLDPLYYPVLENVAHADTILCPSFSPGIGAFKKTLVKGLAGMILSMWINTCSAKTVSLKGSVADVLGIIQLPDAQVEVEPLSEIRWECDGLCSEELCYFDVNIEYRNSRFWVETAHCQYA